MATDGQKDTSVQDIRTRLLDATEAIMIEEGYAGVSSRKVAARAGLKSKLLHYYFANMDELFVAAFERRHQEHLEHFAAAAASDTPLRDIWAVGLHGARSSLNLEFNALASHCPRVREVIAQSNLRDRMDSTACVEAAFRQRGIDTEKYPPKVFATAIAAFARVFATDEALGTDEGHREVREFVERLIGEIEPLKRLETNGIVNTNEQLRDHDV